MGVNYIVLVVSHYNGKNNIKVRNSSKNNLVFTAVFLLWRKMSIFRCRSPPTLINFKKIN